ANKVALDEIKVQVNAGAHNLVAYAESVLFRFAQLHISHFKTSCSIRLSPDTDRRLFFVLNARDLYRPLGRFDNAHDSFQIDRADFFVAKIDRNHRAVHLDNLPRPAPGYAICLRGLCPNNAAGSNAFHYLSLSQGELSADRIAF